MEGLKRFLIQGLWVIPVLIMFFGFVQTGHCEQLDRTVYVSNMEDGKFVESHASGFVWECLGGKGTVVVAFHSLRPRSQLFVNARPVRVVWVDTVNDLAFVEGDIGCKDFVEPKIGKAEIGDQVFYAGFPADIPAVVYGRVISLYGGRVYTDQKVVGGCSGSPLWNSKEELVGVAIGSLTANDSREGFLVATPSERLKK